MRAQVRDRTPAGRRLQRPRQRHPSHDEFGTLVAGFIELADHRRPPPCGQCLGAPGRLRPTARYAAERTEAVTARVRQAFARMLECLEAIAIAGKVSAKSALARVREIFAAR
jgi:hypothetical protein